MTQLAEEAVKLIDSLPPEKARALLEYARYQAKFDAMLKEADREIAEGRTEPLDPKRL